MKAAAALACLAHWAVAAVDCGNKQDRFNVVMCESHMCTDCSLAWCTEACQKIQLDFPGCRCENWAEGRKSFSDGDFAGKGKFGDSGDYAKKEEKDD